MRSSITCSDCRDAIGAARGSGTVTCHQVQHVIQEPDARGNVVPPLSFDSETDANLRLGQLRAVLVIMIMSGHGASG